MHTTHSATRRESPRPSHLDGAPDDRATFPRPRAARRGGAS
jgi:hypothetical protein